MQMTNHLKGVCQKCKPKNKNAVALGRAGGQKTKANMPKDYYKKLQEKSVKARKKNRTQTKLQVNDENMAINKGNSAIHK